MKNKILVLFVLIAHWGIAQINLGGIPKSWEADVSPLDQVDEFTTDELNMSLIEQEDTRDEESGLPPRFGYPHQVSLNPENAGSWEENIDNGRIWRLRVTAPKAHTINFLFSEFHLKEGALLHIYSADKGHLIGAFSSINNKGSADENRGFGTGLVYGESVVLELYEPEAGEEASVMEISTIVHGYRYISEFLNPNKAGKTADFGDSGGCQVDVNCSPEGDAWQNEKTGVALILLEGSRICTGSLVNNTCLDGEPLFLTADHCLPGGIDALEGSTDLSSFSFMWHYEVPECNDPNQSEPDFQVTNGAVLLSNNDRTDFALLKLDESPVNFESELNTMFNGWSRTEEPGIGGVGIHHPRGDVKKISHYLSYPVYETSCAIVPTDWWEVSWASTANGHSVQQPGSSGSPLFTNRGYIIGQLFGPMFCPNIQCEEPGEQQVVYGRVSVSWDSDSRKERQLKHWLDPCETGVVALDGGYFNGCNDVVVLTAHSGPTTYQAGSNLYSTAFVDMFNYLEIDYIAGNKILLNPGFKTRDEYDFHAYINDCSPQVLNFTHTYAPYGKKEFVEERQVKNEETADLSYFDVFPTITRGMVEIEFTIPEYAHNNAVKLVVSDLAGRNYAILQEPEMQSGMYHTELSLDQLSPGTYFVTLLAKDYRETRKIIIR
jgi:lysyl endopeptidase